MGEQLSRREFVRGAAVAIAGAALSGSRLQLVQQAARSLKAKAAAAAVAAEAVDPDPDPELAIEGAKDLEVPPARQMARAIEFVRIWEQLDPGGKQCLLDVMRYLS